MMTDKLTETGKPAVEDIEDAPTSGDVDQEVVSEDVIEETTEAAPQEEKPAGKKIHSRRNEVYESVRNRLAEEMKGAEEEPATEEPAEEPPAEPEEEEVVEEAAAEESSEESPAEEPPQPRKLKLKINGEEREVTEEEAVAAAQQHYAAEDELVSAKNLKKQLQTALAEARELLHNSEQRRQETDQSQPKDAAEAAPTTGQQEISDDRFGEIVDSLQVGDRDEGVKALKSLFAEIRQDNPSASPEAIAAHAVDTMRREMAAEAANREFATRYPEIYADQDLAFLTVKKINERCLEEMRGIGLGEEHLQQAMQNPQVIPIWHRQYRERGYPVSQAAEIADKAALEVKERYYRSPVEEEPAQEETTPPAPAPQEQETSPASPTRQESRVAEKRAEQQNHPRQASKVARQAPPRQKTQSEVIAEMRGARRFIDRPTV